MECITTSVDEYLANNCPSKALGYNREYFDFLFDNFYQGRTSIYKEGNELEFQDLLSEMSKNSYIGQFTRDKWLQLCSRVTFTSSRPDINRICG